MNTIRRLYFYGLALISIEVVIWGAINLLRTVVSDRLVGEGSLLAAGLSLVIVGLPIFYLHWRTVQRDAAREPEERSSRTRAVFLYAALFVTFVPLVYSPLALINRGLVNLLGGESFEAWFGGDGTAVDNIIAILINGTAFAYFWSVLRGEWQAAEAWRAEPDQEGAELDDRRDDFWQILSEARRLYRYLWMLTGLALLVSGSFNLLRYLLETPGSPGSAPILAAGLALALVGGLLWWRFWKDIQFALYIPEERLSLLRLLALYLICLAGVVGVLTAAGGVLNSLIRWILGESTTLVEFFQGNSAQLAAVVPLAVMWSYFGNLLNREVAGLPGQPRRAALRHLYYYILSLLGLAVTFAGLLSLVSFLAQLALAPDPIVATWRGLLSGALSALLVGLPLWLMTWPLMQKEAALRDDTGDRARRSLLRRAYLYLVLFLLVIGAMGFAGRILYTLFSALFGQPDDDLPRVLLELILWLIVDVVFLVYHWRSLLQDGRMAQQTLENLHAAFPTLILAEEGDSSQFAEAAVQALKRIAPRLPVAINLVERGAPDESLLGAKAVLLPMNLAIDPPESLRMWLAEYSGRRILIPQPREGWVWLGQTDKKLADRAREAAQTLRQLAEGEAVRQTTPSSPWAVAGYILGGLFGLQLLVLLFVLMISSLFR